MVPESSIRATLTKRALQGQVLACVQWLCDVQVLACIPRDTKVLYTDVVEILNIPEGSALLRSTVRMTATVSFLHEPSPGYIAHTPLSAAFVDDPTLVDAVTFLSKSALPAATNMSKTSGSYGDSQVQAVRGGSFNAKVCTVFSDQVNQQPRLARQTEAFLHHALSDGQAEEAIVDIVMQLDWRCLDDATVVLVSEAPDKIEEDSLMSSSYFGCRLILAIRH